MTGARTPKTKAPMNVAPPETKAEEAARKRRQTTHQAKVSYWERQRAAEVKRREDFDEAVRSGSLKIKHASKMTKKERARYGL